MEKYNPLVSVIVPNYNHARYLEQRLDTVFNQTYQNFEVIILDDKSTDNSLEIINRYKDNPHLSQIVVNEQNSGSPFKQWDKGINLAKGELVWIAESDDYNELTFLEELITEWQKYKNIVVAFSSYVQFWGDEFIYPKERKTQCWSGKYFVRNRQARGNHILNASGAVFSKATYEKIEKRFLTFKSAGDYMFWCEMLLHGDVLKLNKNLVYWRKHNTSVTSKNRVQGIIAKEDHLVVDYIANEYGINKWQKKLAYQFHWNNYLQCNFKDDTVRQQVYDLWNIRFPIRPINRFTKWLIGSLERHTNILL